MVPYHTIDVGRIYILYWDLFDSISIENIENFHESFGTFLLIRKFFITFFEYVCIDFFVLCFV